MFSNGLVEETEHLLARYGQDCRPFLSLGYKQVAMLLRGDLSMGDAIASTQQGHRNYAKRQMTWFRREPDVHWLDGFGDDPAIAQKALAEVEDQVGQGGEVREASKSSLSAE
jgi:tRNA dimethylallyltransferase